MKQLPVLPIDEIAPIDSSFENSNTDAKVVSAFPLTGGAIDHAPMEDPLQKTGEIPISPWIGSPFEIVPEDELMPLNPFAACGVATLPVQTAVGV